MNSPAEFGERLCPTCGDGRMQVFFEIEDVPTNSCILLETEEAARAWPRGRVALAFCGRCGFVLNVAFDPHLTEYSERYEETQGFSPTFQKFHRRLATELVERHDLRHKKIVEIGCGKGEFLHLLCSIGDNSGLGFDPAYIADREQPVTGSDVQFVADYFSDKYQVESADFVACKMTLEHIPETGDFIRTIRRSVHGDDQSVVFIQVPESTRILGECALEDIYYEHCSYFSPVSLSVLMERCGFHVSRTDITYGQQYLTVEATWGKSGEVDQVERDRELDRLRSMVATFPERAREKLGRWRDDIGQRVSEGQNVVIWGSGSKGVAFLSALGQQSAIRYAVDINPHRHGYYMPGGGQRIIAPEALKEIQPDYVVVMNPVYVPEIRETLSELGLEPEITAL